MGACKIQLEILHNNAGDKTEIFSAQGKKSGLLLPVRVLSL